MQLLYPNPKVGQFAPFLLVSFDRFKRVNLSRFKRVNLNRPYWVCLTVFSIIGN